MSNDRPLNPPRADRLIAFHELLLAARKTWLVDALRETLARVDPDVVQSQLSTFAPADARQILASVGIRGEQVFPTPIVLETTPTLVGYYRLLTGVGQKSFYRGSTGLGPFSRMESDGLLLPTTRERLPDFCTTIGGVVADLVRALAPTLNARDIADLQLLTLGSNFYGGANNKIGQAATKGVFDAIASALSDVVIDRDTRSLVLATSDGRTFTVVVSSDPDIAVRETTDGDLRHLIAIEIKGGSDAANVYNRGGEAEKSHQGAKSRGYLTCWTVIRMSGIDVDKLKRGSPATDAWFDTSQILSMTGEDWDRFVTSLHQSFGIVQ